MTPPLLKGGQGRSDDSIRDTAGTLFYLAIALGLFVVAAVLRGCR